MFSKSGSSGNNASNNTPKFVPSAQPMTSSTASAGIDNTEVITTLEEFHNDFCQLAAEVVKQQQQQFQFDESSGDETQQQLQNDDDHSSSDVDQADETKSTISLNLSYTSGKNNNNNNTSFQLDEFNTSGESLSYDSNNKLKDLFSSTPQQNQRNKNSTKTPSSSSKKTPSSSSAKKYKTKKRRSNKNNHNTSQHHDKNAVPEYVPSPLKNISEIFAQIENEKEVLEKQQGNLSKRKVCFVHHLIILGFCLTQNSLPTT